MYLIQTMTNKIEKIVDETQHDESDDEVEDLEGLQLDEDTDSEYDGSQAEEDNDLTTIIDHFFTNEDGENLADILSGFKKSLDTQNKILMKIANILNEKNKAA